jgi:hypothetical protein
MYDRLRSRAQTFEILTGGDPLADKDADTSWLDPDDLGAATRTDYVPLPNEMLEKLRVNLAVDSYACGELRESRTACMVRS